MRSASASVWRDTGKGSTGKEHCPQAQSTHFLPDANGHISTSRPRLWPGFVVAGHLTGRPIVVSRSPFETPSAQVREPMAESVSQGSAFPVSKVRLPHKQTARLLRVRARAGPPRLEASKIAPWGSALVPTIGACAHHRRDMGA